MRKFRDEFWWKTENSIREKVEKSRERWEKKSKSKSLRFLSCIRLQQLNFPPLFQIRTILCHCWASTTINYCLPELFFCLLLSLQFEFRPPHRPTAPSEFHSNKSPFLPIHKYFSVENRREREEKSPKFFFLFSSGFLHFSACASFSRLPQQLFTTLEWRLKIEQKKRSKMRNFFSTRQRAQNENSQELN